MEDVKPWYLSKSVIGGMVTLGAILVATLFGVQVDAATQQMIVDQTVAFSTAAVAIIGTGVSIYGRITASKKIGSP